MDIGTFTVAALEIALALARSMPSCIAVNTAGSRLSTI